MKVIKKISILQKIINYHTRNKNTIGFIPTMGALHKGHLSLVQKARSENNIVIVSIFVNPKQFNNQKDLDKYPHTLEQDKALIKKHTDYIFCPHVDEMYPEGFQSAVHMGNLANILEGEYRLGHFDGMATVVLKLLHLCRPTRIYMGLKDYQQFIVVSQMVEDLNINVKIIGVPTVREWSGLAMSSRNVQLSDEDRRVAAQIYKALLDTKNKITSGERNPHVVEQYCMDLLSQIPKSNIEYVAVRTLSLERVPIIQGEIVLLVAIFIGSVRLIDNIIIFNKNHSLITSRDLRLIL